MANGTSEKCHKPTSAHKTALPYSITSFSYEGNYNGHPGPLVFAAGSPRFTTAERVRPIDLLSLMALLVR